MSDLMPRHWQHFALFPLMLLSEGRCPICNIVLIDTYCSVCQRKWKLSTFKGPADVQFWKIHCVKGTDQQWMIGDQESLVKPPFPG